MRAGREPAEGLEGVLRRRDGRLIDVVLVANPIELAGRRGLILLMKPVGGPQGAEGEGLEELCPALPGGVYRVELGVGTDWYGSEAAFGDDSWITDATIGCSGMDKDNSLELKAGLVCTIKLKDGDTPKEVTADGF